MKKLFSTGINPVQINLILLILRVGLSSLMLVHGVPKLISLLSGEIAFPSVFGLSPAFSLALAVSAEVFGSILVLVGLGTRMAVLPLIATMLVAVFLIHAADPFANRELGLLYLLGFVVLMIAGSGKYSLDNLVQSQFRSVKPVTDFKIRNEKIQAQTNRLA